MRLISLLVMLLVSSNAFSQTLYVGALCKEECSKCAKSDPPMKVTYKADKQSNKIFRTVDDQNPHILADCTIIDEGNWVCPGVPSYSDYSKQYAVKGIAYWNDSEKTAASIEFAKKFGNKYSCRYEKSLLGGYKVIEEIKRY